MPSGYELVVKIGADTSDVRKGLKKTGQQVDNFDKKVKKAGAGFKGTTSGMLLGVKRLRADVGALTFAAGALTGALGLMVKSQVDSVRETKRWSKMLDISETSLSSLTVVGKRFNVSLDDVASGMSDMSLKITDAANGAKPFEEILNKIGLNSADLIKLKPDQQFLKLADAISAADSELKKFALDELGSDPLLRMIGMLDQGSDGLKAMIKDVEDLGQSMSASDFRKMSELSESIMEANIELEAATKTMTLRMAPALSAIVKLTTLTSKGLGEMADAAFSSGDEMTSLTERAGKLAGMIAQVEEELASTKAGEKWFVNVETETKKVTNQLNILKNEAKNVNTLIAELSAERSADSSEESEEGGGTLKAEQEAKAREIGLQARADALQVYAANELIAKAEHDKMMAEATELGLIAEADARQVYAANAIIAKAEQYALELEANKGFWASMFEIDRQAGKANADLWASGWKGKQAVASKFMGQMSQLMNTNSRKQFEIGKAAAIAQVAIDTPKAAMSAYSAMAGIPIIGPALGVAAAGSAIASGVAQMQNIKSQSMGGGSNASAGGIQAASGGAGDDQGGGGGGQENVTNFDVNLQGQSFSGEQIRLLLSGINSELEDGAKLGAINVR
tara:strand:- start:3780 stop:5654 length:1875 start_codon:yes stop_codon:yes gene_type:complete